MRDTYCGDSWNKKFVRSSLYGCSGQRLFVCHHEDASALVLCGPDAAEIPIIEDELGIRQENIYVVDTVEKNLINAKKRYPGIKSVCGRLEEVIDTVENLAFVHLDFMNSPVEHDKELFSKLKKRLVPGGILAYTFLDGRESDFDGNFLKQVWLEHQEGLNHTLKASLEHEAAAKNLLTTKQIRRRVLAMSLAKEAIGHDEPFVAAQYVSNKSPMFCFAIQDESVFPAAVLTTLKKERSCNFFVNLRRDNNDICKKAIRDQVVEHRHLSATKISRRFNIPVGVIAAWRAVATTKSKYVVVG